MFRIGNQAINSRLTGRSLSPSSSCFQKDGRDWDVTQNCAPETLTTIIVLLVNISTSPHEGAVSNWINETVDGRSLPGTG